MKMKRFEISIGGKPTRIHISAIRMSEAEDYVGGYHNWDGIRGFVVNAAVKKLFGRRAFWFGDADDLSHGQVFEALPATKNNSSPGNTSRTSTIRIDVLAIDRIEDENFPA